MWKKYPRQMLRSRVVSEGVRTVYPLATSGLYVEEEVCDFHADPPSPDPIAGPAEPIDQPEADMRVQPARRSARQLKAEGEDRRIRELIEESDLDDLADWEERFEEHTGHLPRAWLDPVRDWITLRREEIQFEAACAEMDEEYAATVCA
jgi:hypothetical protein